MLPKITIIMPVYNAEKYLHESVDSLLNQTFHDFELLIIDDSSTDSSTEIIQEYAKRDSRVRVVKNVFEKGIVGALNSGLTNARGKYIARADADDIYKSNRLMDQYKYLEDHSDIYILGGAYAVFSELGHKNTVSHPISTIELGWKCISDSFFCHPTVMFRKKIFEEFGGYPNEEAEDFAYFSKVLRKYKGTNLTQTLIDYREHTTNRSLLYRNKIAESIRHAFNDNFFYYTRSLKNADIFFTFHHDKQLNLKNALRVFILSIKISERIRTQYKISKLSSEYLSHLIKIIYCIPIALIRNK